MTITLTPDQQRAAQWLADQAKVTPQEVIQNFVNAWLLTNYAALVKQEAKDIQTLYIAADTTTQRQIRQLLGSVVTP